MGEGGGRRLFTDTPLMIIHGLKHMEITSNKAMVGEIFVLELLIMLCFNIPVIPFFLNFQISLDLSRY